MANGVKWSTFTVTLILACVICFFGGFTAAASLGVDSSDPYVLSDASAAAIDRAAPAYDARGGDLVTKVAHLIWLPERQRAEEAAELLADDRSHTASDAQFHYWRGHLRMMSEPDERVALDDFAIVVASGVGPWDRQAKVLQAFLRHRYDEQGLLPILQGLDDVVRAIPAFDRACVGMFPGEHRDSLMRKPMPAIEYCRWTRHTPQWGAWRGRPILVAVLEVTQAESLRVMVELERLRHELASDGAGPHFVGMTYNGGQVVDCGGLARMVRDKGLDSALRDAEVREGVTLRRIHDSFHSSGTQNAQRVPPRLESLVDDSVSELRSVLGVKYSLLLVTERYLERRVAGRPSPVLFVLDSSGLLVWHIRFDSGTKQWQSLVKEAVHRAR